MRTDPYVSRGGQKLDAALDAFGLSPRGWVCADFGANVGGFTDCLLRRGAAKVYAIDTGYGELAWRLRKDPRVAAMERTNALFCAPVDAVDLVVADMAWTPQRLIFPAAMAWLRPGGCVLSLLKCHYEAAKSDGSRRRAGRRPLEDAEAAEICLTVCAHLAAEGTSLLAVSRSPLRGKGGNVEYWLWGVAGAPGRDNRK